MTLAESFFTGPPEEAELRRCSACKEWKPLTRENWTVYKRIELYNGEPTEMITPKPYCKPCMNEKNRGYYVSKKYRDQGILNMDHTMRAPCECCGVVVANRKTVIVNEQPKLTCWSCADAIKVGPEEAKKYLSYYNNHMVYEYWLDLDWEADGYGRAPHQGNYDLEEGHPPHSMCITYQYIWESVVRLFGK